MSRGISLMFVRLVFVCVLTTAAATSYAQTLVVNSQADTHDLTPGDGLCVDANGHCTLRAAIEEANAAGADSILFASGVDIVRLDLGALVVTVSNLHLLGDSLPTIIDGALNPEGTDLFDVRGDRFRISGVIIAHSRRNGIRIIGRGAHLGAPELTTGVIGNGQGDTSSAGVAIAGVDSAEAVIANVRVGVSGNGTTAEPNQCGIRISNSSGVTIGEIGGGNIISGNNRDGIVVEGHSFDVLIKSNCIGLDITRRNELPNGHDGISIRGGSHHVVVGGISSGERNLISANRGNGISIAGTGTRDNLIASNLIGLDSSGYFNVGNQGAGISISGGARHNRIGVDSLSGSARLVVAGSHGNGIEVIGVGTDSNQVDWTYVGSDARGDGGRPNGSEHGQGMKISGGAKFNLIGSGEAMPRNVIVGNYGPGVTISGSGTNHNAVIGNYVGVYRLGTSPFGNSAGVVIRDSAQFNQIGNNVAGNLISGNRGDLFPLGAGVVIFGTETNYNSIQNNRIGTDYTGTRTIRNLAAGIIIGGGASFNLIGGDSSTGNQISGNGTLPMNSGLAGGVHLYGDGTDYNEVSGNLIGVAADKSTPLANSGHGVGIFGGASHTMVGGDIIEKRNIIAANRYSGVWIDGNSTTDNSVRYNSMYSNDSGGIALVSGSNGGIAPAAILGGTPDSVWGTAEPHSVVDLYSARVGKLGRVQGFRIVGHTVTGSDGSFACLISGLVAGDSVTALQTAASKGSSEFSPVFALTPGTSGSTDSTILGSNAVLHQNQPNPFNSGTVIRYTLSSGDTPRLEIFNTAGQRVKLLPTLFRPAGEYGLVWDGTNDRGETVASGTYFYRLTTSGGVLTKKMLLVK